MHQWRQIDTFWWWMTGVTKHHLVYGCPHVINEYFPCFLRIFMIDLLSVSAIFIARKKNCAYFFITTTYIKGKRIEPGVFPVDLFSSPAPRTVTFLPRVLSLRNMLSRFSRQQCHLLSLHQKTHMASLPITLQSVFRNTYKPFLVISLGKQEHFR